MSFCQAGDFPAVYYKFAGQSNWQNVKLAFAPIDVQVQTIDGDSDDKDGDGKDGDGKDPNSRVPCPPEGTICTITATTTFVFSADGVEVGYSNRYDTVVGNYGWFFEEKAIAETDDGYRFQSTAKSFYRFTKGISRPTLPDDYYSSFQSGDWGYSDSCFPNGGDPSTCVSGDEPPPDKKKDDDKKDKNKKDEKTDKLKVLYNNQIIWQTQGKHPCSYSVSCDKDKCPPDFLKLPSSIPKEFCCIPCAELMGEISQIKALLRQTNG